MFFPFAFFFFTDCLQDKNFDAKSIEQAIGVVLHDAKDREGGRKRRINAERSEEK